MIGRLLEWLVVGKLAKWFPKRWRIIPGRDKQPLLRQFKITNWCYLQSFVNTEKTDLFHFHRWEKMYSIVLSGLFQEERYPGLIFVDHKAPSVYSMDRTVIHRICYIEPRTWTLFFMFSNKKNWGYYRRPEAAGYIPSDQVITDDIRVEHL